MDVARTEQEFLLDTCEQKVNIEELFGFLIFLAEDWKKKNVKSLLPHLVQLLVMSV